MNKLWGGKNRKRVGLSVVAASSVLALGGMLLPGLATPAAADAASDALAYQSDSDGYGSGENCLCAFAWADAPAAWLNWNNNFLTRTFFVDDSLWSQATKKVYAGSLGAGVFSSSLVFGEDVVVGAGSSGSVRPYEGSAVSGFQTRILCNLGTGSGAQTKVLFQAHAVYGHVRPAYPVGGLGFQFSVGAGRPDGYDQNEAVPLPADGALVGLNLGGASDYPVPLRLDVKTGDSSWTYEAKVLPAGVDEAVFQVASIARTPQTVRYRSLSSWDFATQTSNNVCRQDEIGSSSFGNCAAVVVQHIRVVRPSVLVADRAATAAGVPVSVDVLANDSLSAKAGAIPDGFSVAPKSGRAEWVQQNGRSVVRYTPVAGYEGVDSFTYQVRDENLGVTRTATVTITVGAQPVPPKAVAKKPLPTTGGDDAAGLVAVVGVAGAAVAGVALRRHSR